MDPITRESFKKVLFRKDYLLPVMLAQHKKDRDAGKTLCPKMDKVVNIYSQVLTDYPAPVTEGIAK